MLCDPSSFVVDMDPKVPPLPLNVNRDRGVTFPLVVHHQLFGLADVKILMIVIPCDEAISPLYSFLLSLLVHPCHPISENFWRWWLCLRSESKRNDVSTVALLHIHDKLYYNNGISMT